METQVTKPAFPTLPSTLTLTPEEHSLMLTQIILNYISSHSNLPIDYLYKNCKSFYAADGFTKEIFQEAVRKFIDSRTN